MNVLSPGAHRPPSRRLAGSLCLHWFGTAICCLGLLILARDGLAWFRQGVRVDLAITTLSGILPAFLHFPFIVSPPWDRLLQGSLDFCGATPLSLFLVVLGWCARTLAQVYR